MKDLYRKIKNFIHRGRYGWCPEDTWCLDWYLARVIAESTMYLAANLNGHPDNLTEKEWKRILNKISKGMIAPSLAEELDYGKDFLKKSKEAYKKQGEALELLVKYFNSLWD